MFSLSLWLCLCFAPLVALAEQTVFAADSAHVTPVGRPYPGDLSSSLGMSWLGGGVRVSHTGTVLRATFAATTTGFKIRVTQAVQGYFPVQGVLWIPGSNVSETVPVASGNGGGICELVLNMAPQYFGHNAAQLLSLTTDGAFGPAPAPPAIMMHVLVSLIERPSPWQR